MCLAFSSSRLRVADRFFPARLMKNWIMRMPEPMPFGLTFLLAMPLAMVLASLVNRLAGGKVETVFTLCDHFFGLAMTVSCRANLEYYRAGAVPSAAVARLQYPLGTARRHSYTAKKRASARARRPLPPGRG